MCFLRYTSNLILVKNKETEVLNFARQQPPLLYPAPGERGSPGNSARSGIGPYSMTAPRGVGSVPRTDWGPVISFNGHVGSPKRTLLYEPSAKRPGNGGGGYLSYIRFQ